jgi:hypothetical protein
MNEERQNASLNELRVLPYESNSAFRGKMNTIDTSAVKKTGKK